MQSFSGTRVNTINITGTNEGKQLHAGDVIGFGCETENRHTTDVNDNNYFVYKLEQIGDTVFPLINGPVTRENQDASQPSTSTSAINNNNNANRSVDIKPTLRPATNLAQQKANNLVLGIKEEISWCVHEYEKQNSCGAGGPSNAAKDVIDLCNESDDDLIIVEPMKKRQRSDDNDVTHQFNRYDVTNVSAIEMNASTCSDFMNNTSKMADEQQPTPISPVEIIHKIIARITQWECAWIVDSEVIIDPLEFRVVTSELPLKFEDFPTYRRYSRAK